MGFSFTGRLVLAHHSRLGANCLLQLSDLGIELGQVHGQLGALSSIRSFSAGMLARPF
jgi:hypothetical protein